ncbi:GFA family protein [Vibrio sinaloensis]|uniref:GFA family protein n=1 Tax=Photobacterium sp. (strain ATCC 43367) TaxID=379097 RepID=UPI0035E71F57
MNQKKVKRYAECSCGQVSLTCSGEPERTSICHCFECQKRTGSVFGVQARFDKQQVKVVGEVTTYTRVADSGNHVTYQFCPQCGSTVSLSLSALPEVIVIPVGIFNQHDLPTPSFSVYEERQHQWVKFDCQLEHYH